MNYRKLIPARPDRAVCRETECRVPVKLRMSKCEEATKKRATREPKWSYKNIRCARPSTGTPGSVMLMKLLDVVIRQCHCALVSCAASHETSA